ncbi:MAG: amidohydrolase family protein [Chitinivibrionales bacterium]|nr:amidohydrolase family protein [Chitinivibrionales bacterium]
MLIANGRVIDPAVKLDKVQTLCVENGHVKTISDAPPADFEADRVIDAAGLWVVPGLMDMHVHLREPGGEDKETIATGTQAAAAGGVTAVACMPNTDPVLDEESKIRYVVQRGETCTARIYPVGSISKNLLGDELSPFGEMVKAGACAVSDDGKAVHNSLIMKSAFNYAKSFDIPIICHCEDKDLAAGAHMNEGPVSTRLGIRGIPSIAEEIFIARDIMLAEYTGARVHIAHVSSRGGVQIIREAKKRGVQVTCETCPHYLTKCDEDLVEYDTHLKMNPPLRTPADREALIEAVVDGTIDVIATDHAPHVSEDKKDVEFEAAAFGIIGLETSVGVIMTALVHKKILSPFDMINKMSTVPHSILKTGGGTLMPGVPADITIIDPAGEWTVDTACFYSKAVNTAWEGETLKGCARATILGGRLVFERT